MKHLTKEIYNSVPVYYCQHCLSLKIKTVEGIARSEYCCECGSTTINSAKIWDWEQMFYNRYGYKYLEKDGRKHY